MVKKGLLILSAVLALAVLVVVVWGLTPLGPGAQAQAALESSGGVRVTAGEQLVFQPDGVEPRVGLVIYPGARVDARSYAPVARAIAAQGYLVVIRPAPLSLAVLAPGAAADVIADFPAIQAWAVGGHSLGGVMAASFAAQNPDSVRGLVLWASYPASDLSALPLEVLSVTASRDGLTSAADVTASADLLPPDTSWVVVEGGNHAGFGDYGAQPGDLPATLAPEAQWQQIAQATAAFLARIDPGQP